MSREGRDGSGLVLVDVDDAVTEGACKTGFHGCFLRDFAGGHDRPPSPVASYGPLIREMETLEKRGSVLRKCKVIRTGVRKSLHSPERGALPGKGCGASSI